MPHTPVNEGNRAFAKRLRQRMTRAETLLWRHIKAHRLEGLAFRRQVPMGPYIADFVGHGCRLVIEIDGGVHDFASRQQADAMRDAWFVSLGYRVLRVTNDDVLMNLEGVTRAIVEAAVSNAPPSLTLPLKGGGNDKREFTAE